MMTNNSSNNNNNMTISNEDGDDRPALLVDKSKWYARTRYLLVFMGFIGFANVYALRVNLSIAIVSMLNHTALRLEALNHNNAAASAASSASSFDLNAVNLSYQDLDICPPPASSNESEYKADSDGPFVWNENDQALVLASFFYGYVFTQYPGGRLGELFGGKIIFGLGVLIPAVLTLVTPVAANTSFSLLIAVRVIMGLGEGVTYPVMLAIIAKWAPPQERSRMVSFIYGGVMFGTLVSTPIAGQVGKNLGWEWIFYVLGIFGVLWCICWQFLCFDSPEKHPWISKEEKEFILMSIASEEKSSNTSTPWRELLTSLPFWSIAVTYVAYGFTNLLLLADLPTYMHNILYYNIKDNGNIIALFYLTSWIVGILSPIIVDCIIERGYMSRTWGRKLANSVGTFIPAFALIGVTQAGCDTPLIIGLFALLKATMGAVYAGQHSNMLDIAPNYAGTMMGIINPIASCMGFVAPQIAGAILNHHETLTSWNKVFFLAAGINIVGNLVYLVFGSAEEQSWNTRRKNDPKDEEAKRREKMWTMWKRA